MHMPLEHHVVILFEVPSHFLMTRFFVICQLAESDFQFLDEAIMYFKCDVLCW